MSRFALVIVILCALQLAEAKKNVDKINDYLITACGERHFSSNIQALKMYLEEQETKISCFSCKSLTEDLRNLVGLEAIEKGAAQCTVESRTVLGACVKLVGDAMSKSQRNQGHTLLTRLEWLLAVVQEKHKKVCCDLYPKQLEELVAGLDADLIERATEATRDLVSRRDVVHGLGRIGDHLDCRYGHTDLLQLLKKRKDPEIKFLDPIGDERGKRAVNKEKFTQIFKTYLLEPCKYYIEKIGKPFFSPNGADFVRCGGSLVRAWRIYDVCLQVEQNSDRFLTNMINNVTFER